MKIQPYCRKVQYYETDQMGVVHHSNYIRWFEEARTEFLQQIGYAYYKLEQEGILTPIIGISCKYKKPVRFGEEISVTVYIKDYNGVIITFAYEVREPLSDVLRATGETKLVFTGPDASTMIRLKQHNMPLHELLLQHMADQSES